MTLPESFAVHASNILRPRLFTLKEHFGLTRLWLFGPRARGEAQPGTPVDLLAELDRPLSYDEFQELQAILAQTLGQPVELVIRGSLDPALAEIILPELVPLLSDSD